MKSESVISVQTEMYILIVITAITFFLFGHQVFKVKAKEVGDKLLPAFNSPTGIPWAMVNFAR